MNRVIIVKPKPTAPPPPSNVLAIAPFILVSRINISFTRNEVAKNMVACRYAIGAGTPDWFLGIGVCNN